MKNSKLHIKSILERVPRAATAAILASAVSAFALTGILDVNMEGDSLHFAMLLCAVLTATAEIFALNNSVLLVSSAVFFGVSGALFFVPSENGSIYTLLTTGGEIASAAALPMILLLCGAICLAICVLNRSYSMRCITAAALIVMLIIFIWLRIRLLTVPSILITAYILIVLCQVCARKLSGNSEKPRDMWFVMFSLIISVIVFLIPYPETRIQWEKLFETPPSEELVQLGETLDIDEISDSDDEVEEIRNSGYTEDQSSLGGWLELTSQLCLQAEFSDLPHTDRLTGSIYDSYIGTGWVYTAEINDTGYFADSEISLTDVLVNSEPYGSVRISHTDVGSKNYGTLFYPPYTQCITAVDSGEAAQREDVRLVFEQAAPLYDAYYSLNPTDCELTDTERENYLALPPELPRRVRNLALTATRGCKDNESKALELMRVMCQYTYETRVSNLPEGRDFVDYFLFTTKKGYCAYFASSMAVMARCAGIPSRYVQGYYIGDKNDQTITVTSDCAHAWAELYIDGRWVIYDPATTPMDEIINTSATDNEKLKSEQNKAALRLILLYSYGITAAAAVIFILFRPFFRRLHWRIQTKRKYGRHCGYQIIQNLGKILWVLAACGMKKAESETLTEFGNRIGGECPWIDEATLEKLPPFFALTGKVLYSSDYSGEHKIENLARAIRKAYIRKYGLARYLRGRRRAVL